MEQKGGSSANCHSTTATSTTAISTTANNSDVDDVVPQSPPPAQSRSQMDFQSAITSGLTRNSSVQNIHMQQVPFPFIRQPINGRNNEELLNGPILSGPINPIPNELQTEQERDEQAREEERARDEQRGREQLEDARRRLRPFYQGVNVHQRHFADMPPGLMENALITPNNPEGIDRRLPSSEMQTLPVERSATNRNSRVVLPRNIRNPSRADDNTPIVAPSQGISEFVEVLNQFPPGHIPVGGGGFQLSREDSARINDMRRQGSLTNDSSQLRRSHNQVFAGPFALNHLPQSYVDQVSALPQTQSLDLRSPLHPPGRYTRTPSIRSTPDEHDTSVSIRRRQLAVALSRIRRPSEFGPDDATSTPRVQSVRHEPTSTSHRSSRTFIQAPASGPRGLPQPRRGLPQRAVPQFAPQPEISEEEGLRRIFGEDMQARTAYLARQQRNREETMHRYQADMADPLSIWSRQFHEDSVDEDSVDDDVDNDDFTSNIYQSLEEASNADESLADFRTGQTPKGNKTKEEEQQQPKEEGPKDADDCGNDGLTCSICFEPWTSTGKHRLCCLKCGHLFGLECIVKWLKTKAPPFEKNCPICKVKCKKADIRNLYATRLIAVDHGEVEQVREQLNKEQDMRRNKDLQIARINMEKSVMAEENKRLQKWLMEAGITGGGASADMGLSAVKRHMGSMPYHQVTAKRTVVNTNRVGGTSRRWYTPLKRMTMSSNGGCRVLDFDQNLQQFAVTQPCPHTSFNNGYGIKRIDAELQSSLFMLVHTNHIKDIKFSPHYNNQILSVGLEGLIKITDLSSKSTVVEYRTPKSTWSCCWDSRNENYIYAGLSNNSYIQYDIRNTNEPLSTFEPQGQQRSPMISLHHVKSDPVHGKFPGRHGGLLSGTLAGGAAFWQANNQSDRIEDFTPTFSRADPSLGVFAGLQYDHATQHCLLTYRPGPGANPRWNYCTHVLYSMSLTVNNEVSFDVIEKFRGSDTNPSLTRHSLFSQADGCLVVATIEETMNQVKVYDTIRRREEMLQVDGRPFDCMPFTFDSNQPNKNFAVLSENSLSIYDS